MLPNVLQTISRAIRERRCLEIRYTHPRRTRIVEPHAVYSGENDRLVLEAYQIRGYAEPGRTTPFWHQFPLAEIDAITPLNESFLPRVSEGFSPWRPEYRRGLAVLVEDDAGDCPAFLPPPAPSRPLRDLFRGRY